MRVSATEGYTPKRNDLMINQVRLIFGEVPSDLDRFITASQAVQGEALKYFIERFRGAKFAPRTGILWWNVRDGWPLISDAVVDWYNRPKAAYDYIKRCQTDVCVMVTDDGADRCTLVAVNDTRQAVNGRVEVTDAASGRRIWAGNYTTEPNGRAVLTGLPAARGQGMWIIRYTDAEGRDRVNHYLYGKIPFRLDDYLAWRDQIR